MMSSMSTRRGTFAVITLATALVGCSTATTPPSQVPPTADPTTPGTAAPTTTASASPAPSEPIAIVPPRIDPEAALDLLWQQEPKPTGGASFGTPTVDPGGRIWAASSYDDVFWIFDRDGKFVESWGEPGTGDGQLNLDADGNPFGAVAFRSDGGFYVADSGNSRIQQFDKDRSFVRAWGSFGTDDGQFTVPIDIDVDGAGHVYVFDDGRGEVHEFDADGRFVRVVATDVGPYAAADTAGNVYAVDTERVVLKKFAPDGTVSMAVDLHGLIGFATGLGVTPSGHIFVASSDDGGDAVTYTELLELDADGKLLRVWPKSGEALAIDPKEDRIYLTNADQDSGSDVRAFALPAD